MPALGDRPTIAICARCRRDVLPQLAQPSWHREKHRATASEREPDPSPDAQKAMRKNARKATRATLRKAMRVHGLTHAAKFFLSLKGYADMPLPSQDCPDCQRLQSEIA